MHYHNVDERIQIGREARPRWMVPPMSSALPRYVSSPRTIAVRVADFCVRMAVGDCSGAQDIEIPLRFARVRFGSDTEAGLFATSFLLPKAAASC